MCFIIGFLFASNVGAKDLLTVSGIWEKVKLVGNYSDTDPSFSDSTTREILVKSAYAWLQDKLYGYGYLEKILLVDSTTTIVKNLEGSTFSSELFTERIKAVRHYETTNRQSLTSMSIDDFNKVPITKGAKPEVYTYDKNHIWFNSYPSAICTIYVWAYQIANSDSCVRWSRRPVLFTQLRLLLVFKTLELCKERERNWVAVKNIRGIVESRLVDAIQKFQLMEAFKDINIIPKVFTE